MRALTWQGKRDVRVETVPDPRSTSRPTRSSGSPRPRSAGRTCTCTRCSGPYLTPGDILGHEPMGIVEEVGAEVTHIRPGDRVVVPFNISCGSCWMCSRGLFAQCETTQVRDQGKGAVAVRLHLALRLGARRPGRVPAGARRPTSARSRCRTGRRTSGSSTSPTSCPPPGRRCGYADVPDGGTLAVLGLGPIGQMATRIGRHLGAERVIGVDSVPERLQMAAPARRRDARHARGRRRRRGADRADRRARPGRRHRRGRHGGARLAAVRARRRRPRSACCPTRSRSR